MNKISTKLALYFTVVVLIMEAFLMFYLHEKIVDNRIGEELKSIQYRGNSHRDVLEDNYSQNTLQHIALMESKTETEVLITDRNHKKIISSTDLSSKLGDLMQRTPSSLDREGEILEADYRDQRYLAAVTPFKTDSESGYVYMFKSTAPLRELIKELNAHFLIAGISSLCLLIIIHFTLSKILTRPLIRMKRATEKISEGDYEVTLPRLGNDEIGELGASINKLSKDLKTMKRDRAEFLGSISHELRTPLTYVQGYTNVALRENIDEHDRQEYLRIIQEETGTIVALVENLFELAKLDENTFTILKEHVELGPLLRKIQTKMAPAFNSEGIQLVVECREELTLHADPIRLEQILLNLLDNARKYSREGSVTRLQVTSQAQSVVFAIRDEGIGIPQSEIPRIFERLYRVEKSRSRELGGTGLGLSIVKMLVDAHGGDISLTSTEGMGTTVVMTMPNKEGEE
ncbi:cell wall metabolism sensor histidine kinase WalK [Bacillus sp. Marseille-Q1617]|uniref:sensor histidine kinase n=1 Tax=Bacillus sp. Marseille-Q1617 TaxID=2736887 RepID=UPI00158D7687|nr:HAMP domain-containing sensor histidine kinase [Bacillus sp. Marseille-Q1617]